MFLARYNYEVVNGKMQKVKYDINEVMNNINSTDSKKLQNFLLDMYQGVLTSLDHVRWLLVLHWTLLQDLLVHLPRKN